MADGSHTDESATAWLITTKFATMTQCVHVNSGFSSLKFIISYR